MDPEIVLRRSRRSSRELVDIVQKLAAERPTMTLSELYKSKIGALLARRFGTLSKGLDRLGFDDWPIQVQFPALSKEDVIVQLHRRHQRGEVTSYSAVARDNGRLLHAALKHYGTWRDAMQAAGLGALVLRRWDKEKVIAALEARRARGEALDTPSLLRDDRFLLAAAKTHFGSLSRALAAAHLPRSQA